MAAKQHSSRLRRVTQVLLIGLAVVSCSDPAVQPTSTTATSIDSTSTASPTTTPQPTPTSQPATTSTTSAPEPVEVAGVVIDFDGNLQEVSSFTLLVEGEPIVLVPDDGVLFDGGPLSHLRDHLSSGAPVRVVYLTNADSINIAIEIGDAD